MSERIIYKNKLILSVDKFIFFSIYDRLNYRNIYLYGGVSMMEGDTIAAISTPVGEGAISIVRLSGSKAVEIANRLFSGKDLTKVASHTLHYGKVVDPETTELVDEVIVSVMRAPKTFTTEDIVEINGHGGMV